MTPTDELWIDMAQFDTEVADGIWDGAVPPDDAPGWWSEIASLARTARGPATDDELAAEDAVIARMTEAILQAAAEDAASATGPSTAPGDAGAVGDADVPEAVPARAGDRPRLSLVVTPAAGDDDEAEGDRRDEATAVAPVAEVVAPVPDAPTAEPPAVAPAPAAELPAPAAVESPTVAEPAATEAPMVAVPPVARRTGRDDGRPRHLKPKEDGEPGGLRLVRRIVAVKAVATTTAVAIGITAAAAATGVVVTVVDPPRSKTPDTSATTATTLEIEVPVVDAGTVIARDGRSMPVHQLTCVLDFGCPDPEAVLGELAPASEPGVLVITTTTLPDGATTTVPGSPGTSLSTATTATTAPPTETTLGTTPTTVEPPPTTGTTTTTTGSTTTTESTTTTTASSPGGASTMSLDEGG